MSECIFCLIRDGKSEAVFVARWVDAFAIVPLNPVVAGHTLVIPRVHVADFTTNEHVSAYTMQRASELVQSHAFGPCNLITSKGHEATQSVFHLHIHVVPRATNDGLALPWYSGRSKKREVAR